MKRSIEFQYLLGGLSDTDASVVSSGPDDAKGWYCRPKIAHAIVENLIERNFFNKASSSVLPLFSCAMVKAMEEYRLLVVSPVLKNRSLQNSLTTQKEVPRELIHKLRISQPLVTQLNVFLSLFDIFDIDAKKEQKK